VSCPAAFVIYRSTREELQPAHADVVLKIYSSFGISAITHSPVGGVLPSLFDL
jgi:hypothetical protein